MLDPRHRVSIEYCVPCSYDVRAVGLAAEMSKGWAPIIERIDLLPSSKGRFEVIVDGELIYSKVSTGRHAEPGEVAGLFRAKVGPELERG
jgi:selenoprotein W-related protein